MPVYHFEIVDRDGLCEDEEGLSLPDAEAARQEALKGARAILAEAVLRGRLDLDGLIRVRDERGEEVFSLSFSDALYVDFPQE